MNKIGLLSGIKVPTINCRHHTLSSVMNGSYPVIGHCLIYCYKVEQIRESKKLDLDTTDVNTHLRRRFFY